MNVLLGPIIYIMDEVDAFYCFQKFLDLIPSYLLEKVDGVFVGCRLIDQIIEKIDTNLHQSLKQQKVTAEYYIF